MSAFSAIERRSYFLSIRSKRVESVRSGRGSCKTAGDMDAVGSPSPLAGASGAPAHAAQATISKVTVNRVASTAILLATVTT
jgi:hypothetical protein